MHSFPFILMLLLMGGAGNGKGETERQREEQKKKEARHKHQSGEQIEIIPKDLPVEISLIPMPGAGKKKSAHQPHEKDKCEHFYGGIGVLHNPMDEQESTVLAAPEGYPAQLAGIKAGDVVVLPKIEEIKGPVGTQVTVTYKTIEGETKTVTLTRDKICVNTKIKKH